MAIDFLNLYGTLGKIAKSLYAVSTDQALYAAKLAEIATAQQGQIARDAVSDLATAATLTSWKSGVASIAPQLKTAAAAVLLDYVKADKPSQSDNTTEAIAELRRQMIVSAESVLAATVSVTPAALATNSGNGSLVSTVKRGDGLQQDLVVPETGFLTCTTDSQTGGATVRQETFTYAGQTDVGDKAAYDWPTGSGASTTVTVIDPTQSNSAGNLLTNSAFETWAGTPLAATGWGASPVVGVWGTDIARASVPFESDGTYCLSFVGDGATLSAIQQKFNDASLGTAGALLPQRSYALGFDASVLTSAPLAGILTVSLVDGNGAVINDDQGVANTTTFDMTLWTTAYAFKSIVFRTPKLLPAVQYLRIKASTAISAGKTVYMDSFGFGLTTALYAGGPSVAIFPGSTKWVVLDGWTLVSANNYGAATYNSGNFQSLFDRWFDMRTLGQLLPTSGGPTRANTLITA